MRRLIFSHGLLELYALALAVVQLPGGVRTDEAKYLLSIPYPHPPLLRTLFASLSWMPYQELFWRFVIASAVVQAVWLLWDLGYVFPRPKRLALASSWLFSAAVVLQAGTVMMAPLTALFGLVCVWLVLRPHPIAKTSAPLIGLFWFLGLFSIYQTVLYLPLLLGVFRKAHLRARDFCLFLGMPLLLLVLYTVAHPLLLASIVHVGSQDAALPISLRLWKILWILLVSGSGMLTVVGIAGILVSGRKELLVTLMALVSYIALTSQEYYAILLTPLLASGVFLLLCKRRLSSTCYLPPHVLMSVLFVFTLFPSAHPSSARETMHFLRTHGVTSMQEFLLMDGPFGHEWQYESSAPIGRFTQQVSSSIEDRAQAIVCTKKTCEEDVNTEMWKRLDGAPVEVWIRR